MKRNHHSSFGFAALELVLILVLVSALGFVGWTVYQNQNADDSQTSSETAATDSTPTVEQAEDLEGAENYLNKTDIDQELDTSEIDAALSE